MAHLGTVVLFLILPVCIQAFLTSCSCKFSVLSWSGIYNQKYLIYFHTSELKYVLIFLLVEIVMNKFQSITFCQ